jgi:predicted nucleotidyltransferase component of viral defense system
MSEKNYLKLYKLQDKVFSVLSGNYGKLYLTGGTVLDRFYLSHRYSEDLDFFSNADENFQTTTNNIQRILSKRFNILTDKLIFYKDFVRIWIQEEDCELKIEFVNDVPYHAGNIFYVNGIPIDNPANILANKLSAVVSRDEPKDVFDVISIALEYSFNWEQIFEHTMRKAIVAEQNIAERLETFPAELFEKQMWLKRSIDKEKIKNILQTIADDFLFARDNSLGKDKPPITEAKPKEWEK